mgnify:CR=1 FL=1
MSNPTLNPAPKAKPLTMMLSLVAQIILFLIGMSIDASTPESIETVNIFVSSDWVIESPPTINFSWLMKSVEPIKPVNLRIYQN